MAYQDVSKSGMNYVTLDQIIANFKASQDSDDYAANASDVALRNFALRGIREFGFDVSARIKSLKLSINSNNNTVTLPEDYVDIRKIGVVDENGKLRAFGQDKNINYSRKTSGTSTSDSSEGPIPTEANLTTNLVDDKTATADVSSSDDYDHYVFENYLYQGGIGRLYGAGGGRAPGEYRINLDQNRIEIDTDSTYSEVVIEYIADEARSTNPVINVYAEEALQAYIYYRICERKSSVPMGEKQRARQEYYNERRKANARLKNFNKEEALRTIRKNFKLAPKY